MECGDRRSSSTTPAISSLGQFQPGIPTTRRTRPTICGSPITWVSRNPLWAQPIRWAQRYQLGLNIALPADWAMQVYFSHTKDKNYNTEDPRRNSLSKSAVSAALGWTIPATAVSGTTPAIATWTKPANVPYLNLFCDPRAYTCNSDATLNYLQRFDEVQEYMHVKERGIKADGPLFDLPGGQVKMAIGANYTTYSVLVQQTNQSAANPIVNIVQDARNRHVWAAFTQLNVPVFGDQNALPGLRRLDLEFSWRHDQYDDVGGTSNAKVGFNWAPIDDSHDPRRLGPIVPRAELRRVLTGLQRGLDKDGISVRPIRRIPSPSTSYVLAARHPWRARSGPSCTIPRPASDVVRLLGDFRTTAAARSPWTADCGIISTSNSRSSIPKRPSTGRSASTTRRQAIFSPA